MKRFDPRVQLLTILIVLSGAGSALAAGTERGTELWYVLELAGQKAGWMHVVREVDDETIRTRRTMQMSLGRGIAGAVIETSSEFTETRDGRPIEAVYRQVMSTQPVETRWVFKKDGIRLTTMQGDRETIKTVPLPEGVWLTPAAAFRYSDERRTAGAERIVFRVLDPESGLTPVEITSERTGEEQYDLDGESIVVSVWSSSSDQVPIESIDRVSEDGHLVQSIMEAGIGRMETRLTTQLLAQADDGGPGPELMVSTFVRVDRPIPDPFRSTHARLRLRLQRGNMPELPSVGAQKVRIEDQSTVELTVSTKVEDALPADPADRNDSSFLESSSMVDAGDALVGALVRSATRGVSEDPLARAEAMRAKVARHISKKGLETAFASAAETARTRTGDCSEHGVLLCAMLRADGIPARVASGLVYADGFLGHRDIFGWHMWTQALIDGRWIDLDATLPTRYHAGHVLTGTSALSDGASDAELGPMLMLMGNLEIEVLEVRHD